MREIPIISVVGKKKSGKTTFLERLIPALGARGVRVAVIKHDVHDFDIDRPGKDTHRLYEAGAGTVIIASPRKVAKVRRVEREPDLDELAAEASPQADVVLTEGYKSRNKPKIEVFRIKTHREPLCGPEDNLVAMVTDAKINPGCPVFDPDDARGVAEFIIRVFLNKK